ncbi:MAG TPA: type II secretion system protein GspE, partial [Patescibacteria group bacterium]|nr:type II secretion system protein GspE [Patescibacteria group bacterium]
HCKKEYKPPKELIAELRNTLGNLLTKTDEEIVLYKGEGCDYCGHSGYLGRIGIFEVLPITPNIAKLILQKSDSQGLEKEAKTEGMITMKQDGYLKVLEGISSIDEILRVAQE